MADPRQPAVRARSAQDWIAYLRKHDAALAERVVEAMPEASRRVVLDTPRTGWIPVEHDRHLPIATIEVLGEHRAVELWAAFLPSHLEAPLFRALKDSMVRLFGLNPSTFVKLIPRAFGQAYRDCCAIEVLEAGDHSAKVSFTDCHPEVISCDAYLTSWRGVMRGAFAVTNSEGDLDMFADLGRLRVDFHWHW